MVKIAAILALLPLASFSQTFAIETQCNYVVITNDTSFVRKVEKQPEISYSCYDSRIGLSTMHWFSVEDSAYIRKRMKNF